MNRLFDCLSVLLLVFFATTTFVACSEDDEEWDPYYSWKVRNDAWFQTVVDSARKAEAEARDIYGDDWEEHCEWRKFKSLMKSHDYDSGCTTDSIYVRIVERGDGNYSPLWTDTVRMSYRGWMMPSVYKLYNKDNLLVDSLRQEVFSQTYYNEYNEATAMPGVYGLTSLVEGFSTALQYMVAGDDWFVYVPYALAYGSTATGTIPAYSTLVWRIHLNAVYEAGSGVPDWK